MTIWVLFDFDQVTTILLSIIGKQTSCGHNVPRIASAEHPVTAFLLFFWGQKSTAIFESEKIGEFSTVDQDRNDKLLKKK